MSTFTIDDFDQAIDNGPYAWPGGYPLFFVMSDGDSLGFQAAVDNADEIRQAILNYDNSGWRVVACCINYDDDFLVCCHDGDPIPSAYGEGGES
jgi:hypothetical protein